MTVVRRWNSGLAVVLLAAVANLFAGDAPPVIDGCQILPADNLWNRDVSSDEIHPNSAQWVADILTGSNKFLHPDFGTNPDYGIPFVVVPGTQPKAPINIFDYADESDPGPHPIPLNAPIEGGTASTGDRHVLVLDKDNKILYEMFNATPEGPGWRCSNVAKFDLTTNALRPDGWTSADAAGLPILPGLAKYDEVAAGKITHALRFTVHRSAGSHIAPATHHAGSTPTAPPMGARFRLKASFDLSGYTGQARVILESLKKYGMMVADNGSDWFITGTSDARWDDDDLRQLKTVPGSVFEAVIAGQLASGGGGGGGGGTSPGGGDTDGDGFSDELEVTLGLSPTDPTSTPFGGAPAGTAQPLEVTKLSARLNFAVTGKDQLSISGLLPIPAGFSIAGQQFIVDAGGVIESFTLDAKGRALATKGAAKVSIKARKGTVDAQSAKFQVKLKGSEFAKALADENMTGTADVRGEIREVLVAVLFNRTKFTKLQPQLYTAKAGKAGASKSP